MLRGWFSARRGESLEAWCRGRGLATHDEHTGVHSCGVICSSRRSSGWCCEHALQELTNEKRPVWHDLGDGGICARRLDAFADGHRRDGGRTHVVLYAPCRMTRHRLRAQLR